MSSTPGRQSSGSEGEPGVPTDDRKRKRMLSNRESARRSRMRKQQHLDDLINQTVLLKNENQQMLMQIEMINQRYMNVEAESSVLRAEIMELKEKLEGLNSVLYIFKEGHGMAMDIPEMPQQLMEPWQLPCPAMPIPISANLLQW